MSRKNTPRTPANAPQSPDPGPQAPTVAEQLQAAVNALRAIQRQRIQEAAAIGRLLGDE